MTAEGDAPGGPSPANSAVLIVAESGDAGGIGRYCVDLASAMGARATLACLCASPCSEALECWLGRQCADRNIALARIWMPPKGWRSGIRGLLALWRRTGRPLVHVNGRRGNSLALALRLGAPGFRYVTTVHGILGLHSRRNAVYRIVDLLAARLATAIVAVSEHGRRDLIRARSPGSRTVTIPNGLADRELSRLRAIAAERPAQGRIGLPARVGYLGRLSPEKGTRELTELAGSLAAGSATLEIAGDGPDRVWLEEALRSVAHRNSIRLRGPVSDPASFLRDVDILVVPSHNEGMPYVVLEGMAAGCAVVAFAVGGIPEVISGRDLGVLVTPGDVAGLIAAVAHLAADPIRVAAMGRAGSDHIAKQFALDGRVPALWDAYGRPDLAAAAPARAGDEVARDEADRGR